MIDINENYMEGSDLRLISDLSGHVFGHTEGNHRTFRSEHKMSLPRYELGTSEIQVNFVCEIFMYTTFIDFISHYGPFC